MTITNTINTEEKRIYTVCQGIMTPDDFDQYVSRIWGDDSYFGYNELFDTTQGDWDNFDFSHLFTVAAQAAKLSTIDPKSKLAWVVIEGKQKKLTDFYQAAKAMLPVESRSLEAFFSEKEAIIWLES